MLPLFKSDFSIGKSILRLDLKSIDSNPETSIFSILKKYNQNNLVLVEDTMTGFLEAHKNSSSLGIQLIFGLRLSVYDENCDAFHKVIIFSNNPQGCIDLNLISTKANTADKNFSLADLSNVWTENISMCIPFYDSFLHINATQFKTIIPSFKFTSPTFFVEENELPFDNLIKKCVINFCSANNYPFLKSKSIYYHKRSQFSAFQTYKCICNRSFSNKAQNLDCPNLDHLSSSEFSFESYLEKK